MSALTTQLYLFIECNFYILVRIYVYPGNIGWNMLGQLQIKTKSFITATRTLQQGEHTVTTHYSHPKAFKA